MQIEAIAHFHSPVGGKFGLPRQAGLVTALRGEIALEKEYARAEALKGLEGFDYIWLIWGFSLSEKTSGLTVRPPRLGGNERVGVFASRSPFRPNSLALSSVRIESIDESKGIIYVSGADLADGTPIYDIKPYITYSDSHPEARSGFVDSEEWKELEVVFLNEPDLSEQDKEALRGILAQDPRPHYHKDPQKVYGMTFCGIEVRFRVESDKVIVL